MISAAPLITSLLARHATSAGLLQGRVYQDQAPQDVTLPCATFLCITDTPQNHLRGRAGLKRQRWQLDIWTTSHAQADVAASAVQDALLNGDLDPAYASAAPHSVVMNDTHPGFEQDSGLRRFTLDFTIWFY